jgi:hypothetical protein
MQGSSLFSTVAKLATVAALCVPFVAQADKSASSASSALTGQRSSLVTFRPGRHPPTSCSTSPASAAGIAPAAQTTRFIR